MLIAVNPGGRQVSISLPASQMGWQESRMVKCLLTGQECIVSGEVVKVNLPARSGVWLA